MKITGLLSWADEKPLWLMAAITAIAPLLDHLVAVDGKYILYPGAIDEPSSNVEQSVAVLEAAAANNIGLTLHRPKEPFYGNEVEKRNLTVQLAHSIKQTEADWVIVFDGDMVARKFDPGYVRYDLEKSDCAVAQYALYESPDSAGFTLLRSVYRVLPGLAYGPSHYSVSVETNDDSRAWLWGNPNFQKPYVDAVDISHSLKFDHRRNQRNPDRSSKANEYYRQRDSLDIERLGETFVQDLDGNWVNVKERVWSQRDVT